MSKTRFDVINAMRRPNPEYHDPRCERPLFWVDGWLYGGHYDGTMVVRTRCSLKDAAGIYGDKLETTDQYYVASCFAVDRTVGMTTADRPDRRRGSWREGDIPIVLTVDGVSARFARRRLYFLLKHFGVDVYHVARKSNPDSASFGGDGFEGVLMLMAGGS